MNIKQIIIASFLVAQSTGSFAMEPVRRLLESDFLSDLKIYKVKTLSSELDKNQKPYRNDHNGDLYEHTMWVARYTTMICSEHNFTTSWIPLNFSSINTIAANLSDRNKMLTIFAAYIHDCGKAGDPENTRNALTEFTREDTQIGKITRSYRCPNHPEIGFDYVMNNLPYITQNGQKYDFDTLFSNCDITPTERKMLAVLIGSHQVLNSAPFKDKNETPNCLPYAQSLVEAITNLMEKAELEDTADLKTQLVTMAIIINFADSCGVYFPCFETTELDTNNYERLVPKLSEKAVPGFTDMFARWVKITMGTWNALNL